MLCWIWGVATTLCRKTLSSRPFSVERTFRPKSVCCSHWAFLVLLFSPRTLNQILKIKRCSDSGIFQEVGTDAVLAHLHFSTEAEESELLAVTDLAFRLVHFLSVQIVNASQGKIWYNCLLVKISSIENLGLRKLTSSFASRGVRSTYWATLLARSSLLFSTSGGIPPYLVPYVQLNLSITIVCPSEGTIFPIFA